MSFENVKEFFKENNLDDRIILFDQSSATVLEAAQALHCEPELIAKTLSFLVDESPVLIVTAGNAKIDNKKYKTFFHKKAKMISADLVEDIIGHPPGGVCPFVVKENVKVYLDISLQRFEIVYPAAGNNHSAVKLSVHELEKYSHAIEWIDVCKI